MNKNLSEKKKDMSQLSAVLDRTNKRKEAKRFIKFGIVGTLGAIIDFSVLSFLVFVVGWSSPIGKLTANIISTSIAILSNFFWNRRWTFPESRSRNAQKQLVQFALVNIIGIFINTLIFSFTDHFIYTHFVSPQVSVLLAKATAIGIVLFWNFGANRLWTYRGL